MKKKQKSIPVVDLFAGPGGLSEGFAALGRPEHRPVFDIAVSMEKERTAHQTLKLRSFFRQFRHGEAPEDYYSFARDEIGLDELYTRWPDQARKAEEVALRCELGKHSKEEIDKEIKRVIKGHSDWILIGGPPCQAYSLIGRARRQGNKDYVPEKDHRHFLYREYLRILADHQPAAFVMENVKGILSSTVREERIFERIVDDLQEPVRAIHNEKGTEYRLYSFCNGEEQLETYRESGSSPSEFIIRSEYYSIPQARHRVIILGVREDFAWDKIRKLKPADPVPVETVLGDLPRLRSGFSKRDDVSADWIDFLRSATQSAWFRKQVEPVAGAAVKARISSEVERLRKPKKGRGDNFVVGNPSVNGRLGCWLIDPRLEGFIHHRTRKHMESDLLRYLYAACFSCEYSFSPRLDQFPQDLLPAHASAERGIFKDRFKVQVKGSPGSTITSHISKDGHYYIHYDPKQCRSLTVREAARIQTFPDNYYFYGNRTQQYVQVGNAVPPFLAYQLAEIVAKVLGRKV